MFIVNLEAIAFRTVKIIVYKGKSYIIAKVTVLVLFRNKQNTTIKIYTSYAHGRLGKLRLKNNLNDITLTRTYR